MEIFLRFIGAVYAISTFYCVMLTIKESMEENRAPVTYNYMLCGFVVAFIPLFNTLGMVVHLFENVLSKEVFWRK